MAKSPLRRRFPLWTVIHCGLAFLLFGLGPARTASTASFSRAIEEAGKVWSTQPGLPLPDHLAPLIDTAWLRSEGPAGPPDLGARHQAQRELDAQADKALDAARRSPLGGLAIVPERGVFQPSWLWCPLVFASWSGLGLSTLFILLGALGLEHRFGRRASAIPLVAGGLVGCVVASATAPSSAFPLTGGPFAASALLGAAAAATRPRELPVPGWAPATAWILGLGVATLFLGGLTRPELWGHVGAWVSGLLLGAGQTFTALGRGPAVPRPWSAGVAGIGASAGVALVALAPRAGVPQPASMEVTSVPRGATVQVDGRTLAQTTPTTVDGLVVGRVVHVEVMRDGYFSEPSAQWVWVTPNPGPVSFELKPRVDIRVETEPSGAVVRLDGKSVGQAPLQLPPLTPGQEAELSVHATDYLPHSETLVADAPTTISVRLEPAVRIEVASDPSPAQIVVDGVERGVTPSFVEVPAERRFELAVTRRGYRPVRRKLDGRRLKPDRTLSFELTPLPIAALPLTPEERGEVQRLRAELNRARAESSKLTEARERAARELRRGVTASRGARLQNVVDRATDRIDELDGVVEDLEGQLEGIRDVVSRREAPPADFTR